MNQLEVEEIETIGLEVVAKRHADYTEQLLQPTILIYLDFHSLINVASLNKRFRELMKDENFALGFWPAVCNSFCAFAGLYSPAIVQPEAIIPNLNYRRHFFDDLWTLRHKWEGNEKESMSYKVRVSCRFRPGEPPAGRVCLPLHQFLRLRRKQKDAQQDKENLEREPNDHIFVGAKDPEEFCDPLLGSLMRDPVMLRPSGRIVDRTVAIQCIHRGGRDPFNNARLTTQMLIPQPELADRIREWRERPERTDISLDIKDVKGLVEDTAVNQDFLEALLEVERMQSLIKKANAQEAMRAIGDNPLLEETAQPEMEEAGETITNEVNPDITVGLIDTEIQQHNPFAIDNLMQMHGSNPDNDAILRMHDAVHDQPQSKKNESSRIVEVNEKSSFVSMHVPGAGVRPFNFSNVYSQNIKQTQIYERTTRDSIEAVLNGCNACVLCYGQTGSGKTYSFLGPEGALEAEETHQQDFLAAQSSIVNLPSAVNDVDLLPTSGMLLRAAGEFFRARALLASRAGGISAGVKLQIVEVYEEKVTDLVTGKLVSVRRDTGFVANGSEHDCSTLLDFIRLYRIAHGRQRFAETAMNERSSRAHTLVIFHVTQQRAARPSSLSSTTGSTEESTAVTAAPEELLVHSQLYLVDLAGSERVKKSKVTGQRMREAVGINSSLLVLGKVISALVEGSYHVPYLESKLTTLLKAAFGGNARTMVLLNARTEEEHGDETLQTLRFGERCGMISNSLKQMASSLEATIGALDQALSSLQVQLQALAKRNKTHLDSYKALQSSYDALWRKKQELLALNSGRNNRQPQQELPSVAKAMERDNGRLETAF